MRLTPKGALPAYHTAYIAVKIVKMKKMSNILQTSHVGDYFLWGIPEKAHTNITHMLNKVNKQT